MVSWLSKIFNAKKTEKVKPRWPEAAWTTAVFALDIASADFETLPQELETISTILRDDFALQPDTTQELILEAKHTLNLSSGLYDFSRRANENLTEEEKYSVILSIWRVAYSDRDLDRYEESSIRKIADLIYVPHSEFIRAKHEARLQSQI